MEKNYLEIKNICKTYKKGKVEANKDISISFKSGEIVALIGHNGAGKTTLLNEIIGIVKPNSGDIIYNGKSLVKNINYARKIVSNMPQAHIPLMNITLGQSIESVARFREPDVNLIRKNIDEVFEELDIKEYKNRVNNRLSGGLKRLNSFAMSVVTPTPIMLFDEPTNDVDPIRRKKIWQYLKKLTKKECIVIVVTHNLLEVEQYADRYILLDKGKVIRDEYTSDLNKYFNLNILNIYLNSKIEKDSIISYFDMFEKEYNENENILILKIKNEQILEAMKIVVDLLLKNEIENYTLSSNNLDMLYEVLLNEK